jgi:RNA polymerase sigma-70 factor (ECF subfamily)
MGDGTMTKEDLLQAEIASFPSPPPRTFDLERIFLEHQGRVYRAAFRVTGSASDAEDVLQTVFLRLARVGALPTDVTYLGSYLYRAGVNAALDLLRARRESASLEDVPEPASSAETEGAERVLVRAALRRAIAKLHPRWAEIFVLRHFEGYGNEEIARMLGVSRAVVGMTLFRTRHRLQKELREAMGDGR